MRSLMRGPVSRTGGALWGLRAMAYFLSVVGNVAAGKVNLRALHFNPQKELVARIEDVSAGFPLFNHDVF